MAKVIKKDEAILLHKFRSLPPEKREEFIDLLDFLTSGKKAENWLEFDEWALNLAKERGFNRLTEEDVARIMSDFRSEKYASCQSKVVIRDGPSKITFV